MNKKWTDEENQIIINARAAGKTYKEMMPLLPDRSMRAIAVQGNKLTPSSRPSARKWTEEEELRLIEMREQGISYPEIAEELGRTYIAVKSKGSTLISSGCMRKWKDLHEEMEEDMGRIPGAKWAALNYTAL